MKRIIILTPILTAFVVLSPIQGTRGAEFESGLVSRWDFNGTLTDSRGKSNDNLVAGDRAGSTRFVSQSEVLGVHGKALALGVEPRDAERLLAPTSLDVRIGPNYTIEAWIHPTHIAEWNRLVLNWGKLYAYHFAIHNGVLSLHHGQAAGSHVFAEGGAIWPGRWYHVAGVARRNEKEPVNSALEVYLNGKQTASGGSLRKRQL